MKDLCRAVRADFGFYVGRIMGFPNSTGERSVGLRAPKNSVLTEPFGCEARRALAHLNVVQPPEWFQPVAVVTWQLAEEILDTRPD